MRFPGFIPAGEVPRASGQPEPIRSRLEPALEPTKLDAGIYPLQVALSTACGPTRDSIAPAGAEINSEESVAAGGVTRKSAICYVAR